MALVLTGALIGPQTTTIRVDGGRIVATGPAAGPEDGDDVIDLRGRRVLPGLRDAHVHFSQWSLARRQLDVSSCRSAREVAARVATAVRSHRGGVLRGNGFQDGLWPDEPHKDLLDRAAQGAAVLLTSHDCHSVWLSSAALQICGMAHETGLLREREAWQALSSLPEPPPDEVDSAVAEAAAHAASRGVTEIVDLELFGGWEGWRRRLADGQGRLPLRVWSSVQHHELDEAIADGRRTGEGDEWLRVGPLKLFADGALGSRTAWCDHEYTGVPGSRGRRLLEREELVSLLRRADAAGLRTTVHAIGDSANRMVLDSFSEAGLGGRIEHAQLIADEDLPRFGAQDVVASIQPAHAPEDRDLADRYWAGRTDRAYPYRALLRAGARLVLGSDAPVSRLDPWRAIACAVHRTDDERPPWHPEQSLTLTEAIDASTSGRILPGERADLVVCDVDPFTTDAGSLAGLPVWGTMCDGRWTYRKD